MKRLCYLIPHAEPGGGERMVYDLCRTLDHSNFIPHILLPAEGRLAHLFRSIQVEVKIIPFKRDLLMGYPPGLGIISYGEMLRVLEQWKIDLIHLNDSYLTLMGGRLGARLKIPVVLTAHGPWDAHFLLQDLLSYTFLKKIWVPTEQIKKALLRRNIISGKSIAVIPFGVDVNRFCPVDKNESKRKLNISDDDLVICRIARFDKVKDYPNFLKSAELIVQKVPMARFLIVGDVLLDIKSEKQKYRDDAIRFVEESQFLRGKVKFVGYQSDVRPFLAASDILVSSSKSESFGFTILEAMAMGIPVVSTWAGGPSELISDSLDGFLVPPEEPKILADKVVELARSKKLRDQLSMVARQKVYEKYDLSHFVREMESEYVKLLGG